jgi:hypothetical protein
MRLATGNGGQFRNQTDVGQVSNLPLHLHTLSQTEYNHPVALSG